MLRKDSARRHTAVLKWLLRLVIKKKWPQGKWPVFPESMGRVHKCFPYSQSGCHERGCQSKATLKGTCPCGQLHRHNGALQRQSSYQEPTAEKYLLYQGKPGERWMASKRGTLKNFKDPRAEMHSKHTPKLEETCIGARETIISSSSFDPQEEESTEKPRSQWRKIQPHSFPLPTFSPKQAQAGNSLVVQWLGLYASTAEGRGSIPSGELDPTCHAAWQKKESRPRLEQGRSFNLYQQQSRDQYLGLNLLKRHCFMPRISWTTLLFEKDHKDLISSKEHRGKKQTQIASVRGPVRKDRAVLQVVPLKCSLFSIKVT